MSQYLEFITNHPLLSGAAIALIVAIVVYEIRRMTRGYAEVEPGDATLMINREDALVVDVRDAAAFEKRHIVNAQSVPMAELDDRLEKLSKHAARPVVVYCDNGIVSGRAASALVRAGFQRVRNLKGGLSAWEAAGLPVVKGRK